MTCFITTTGSTATVAGGPPTSPIRAATSSSSGPGTWRTICESWPGANRPARIKPRVRAPSALELPGEHQRLALDVAARLAVGGGRRGVVVVGEHPHPVTPFLARDVTQRFDERGANAVMSMTMVYRELVQEHLGPLVGMGHLHAGDESDRYAMRVRDQQVMIRVGEELFHRLLLRRVIEKLPRPHDPVLVARLHGPEGERTSWVRPPRWFQSLAVAWLWS